MSVETFDPVAHDGVQMTPAAAAHVRRQLERAGARAMRIGVQSSGCSGYKYELDLVAEPSPGDLEYPVADGLSIYVDPEALPLVRGTEIDLVVEGLNSTLKFRNPNVQVECGCGESFGV